MDKKDENFENVRLDGNKIEKHLEISSTGYGLETVTTSTEAQVQDTEKEFSQK